jgi:hypothetical protein
MLYIEHNEVGHLAKLAKSLHKHAVFGLIRDARGIYAGVYSLLLGLFEELNEKVYLQKRLAARYRYASV